MPGLICAAWQHLIPMSSRLEHQRNGGISYLRRGSITGRSFDFAIAEKHCMVFAQTTGLDKGQLWENFLMCERKKITNYHQRHVNRYFWRNHAQQEIDYIEERDGSVDASEFKWNPKSKIFFSKTFINAYQPRVTEGIHKDNYLRFTMPGNREKPGN